MNENDVPRVVFGFIDPQSEDVEPRHPSTPAELRGTAWRLQRIARTLDEPRDYVKGDLVVWKTGLQNRTIPDGDDPMVVLRVLESPVFDEQSPVGSPYFHEPLDVIVGYFANDGTMVPAYVDGRRIRHATDEELGNVAD